jgi:hypothetical protein
MVVDLETTGHAREGGGWFDFAPLQILASKISAKFWKKTVLIHGKTQYSPN